MWSINLFGIKKEKNLTEKSFSQNLIFLTLTFETRSTRFKGLTTVVVIKHKKQFIKKNNQCRIRLDCIGI